MLPQTLSALAWNSEPDDQSQAGRMPTDARWKRALPMGSRYRRTVRKNAGQSGLKARAPRMNRFAFHF